MSLQQRSTAVAGAIIAAIGAVCPAVSLPGSEGTIRYLDIGTGDGVPLLILLGLIAAAGVAWRPVALVTLSVAAGLLLLFDESHLDVQLSRMRAALDTGLAGNPLQGLIQTLAATFHPSWGWAVMGLGLAVVLLALLLPKLGLAPVRRPLLRGHRAPALPHPHAPVRPSAHPVAPAPARHVGVFLER